MKQIRLALALCLSVILAMPLAARAGARDEQELLALEGRVALVLGVKGFEDFARLFHPDYSNWADGRPPMSRDAYLAAVARWHGEGNHAVHTEMKPVSTEVFGNIALSRYVLREDFNNGESFVGRFASLSRRHDGQWKLYRTNFTTLYRGDTKKIPAEFRG